MLLATMNYGLTTNDLLPNKPCAAGVAALALSEPLALAQGQVVSFNVDLTLGTTDLSGAKGLDLYACVRDSVGTLSVLDPGSFGYQVVPGGRSHFGRSAAYPLPAGTWQVGACGCIESATEAPKWNNAEWFQVLTHVLPAGTPFDRNTVSLPPPGGATAVQAVPGVRLRGSGARPR